MNRWRIRTGPAARALLFAALVAATVVGGPARAESGRFLEGLDTEMVRALMLLTRENLGQARMPDGSAVEAPAPGDTAPVIPESEGMLVVDAGVASGIAEWCGVEWSTGNFLPLMTWQRQRGLWDDRQIAYIGMLHGIALGLTSAQAEAGGDCPAETRARVGNWIAERWSGGGN